jgi:hypothetical protein
MRLVRSGSRLRAAALMTAGALAVHHLRYLAAPEAVHDEGSAAHAYLGVATPLVLAAAMAAWLPLAGVLARAREGDDVAVAPVSFRRAWLAATAGLLAIFLAQELVEGFVAEGHLQALELLHHGGLAAVPAAIAVGAAVALCLRGAHAAIAQAARAALRSAPRRATDLPVPPRAVYPPRRPALTCPGAGRAPPLLST